MSLTRAELEPLLRLTLVEGVGPHRLNLLLARFGSPERVLDASVTELRGVGRIGEEIARRVRSASTSEAMQATQRALRRLESLGATAIDAHHPAYPSQFERLPDPPPLLFALGETGRLGEPAIAVVGTRTPTAYGRRTAEQLCRGLALAGYAVVSGMARGIDTAAHLGVLEAGGTPIGILGHGIDSVYPPENRRLFERAREHGVLLTEYPPGETPKAGNFPRRNRLITALSRGVVVVEMGLKSGAQHTVGFALEQGRDVMAVPGPIGSPASAGTNQLIKEGARVVTCVEDIIEEIEGVGSTGERESAELHAGRATPTLPLLSPAESRMLEALSATPLHVDELASGAELSAPAVLAALLDLELRGLVQALPGMRYARL